MEWFSTWWGTLGDFEHIILCISIPATLILIIQTILVIFGFGDHGAGFNPSDTSGLDGGIGDLSGHDGSFDFGGHDGSLDMGGHSGDIDVSGHNGSLDQSPDGSDTGDGSGIGDFSALKLFTVQTVVAFFTVFGWATLAIYKGTLNIAISLIGGFILGVIAMYGVAKVIQLSARLAQNGTFNTKNLIGESATVYLPIPASNSGKGKVNVLVGERYLEYDAITEEDIPFANNQTVRITDIRSGDIVVVEKL